MRFRPQILGLQVLSLQGKAEVCVFSSSFEDPHTCTCTEMPTSSSTTPAHAAFAWRWPKHSPGSASQQRWLRDASQAEKLCSCSKAAQRLRPQHFSRSDPNPKHNSPSCLDPSLPGGSAAHIDLGVRGCNSHEAHLLCYLNTWTAPASTIHPLFLHAPK